MAKASFRIEKDTMGEVKVPRDAYWGAQTQRAVENFPISDIRFPRVFIRSLGLVKMAAAEANMELKLLDKRLAKAIVKAAREVMEGKLDDQFVVDVFQTGSGTSTNMNANEVIANRANEILGGMRGAKAPVHPNDHVNKGQSSNDVIPSCIHIAALESLEQELIPVLNSLEASLRSKATEFHDVIKTGRTHLQDATPIRLGQEFVGYAGMVANGIQRIEMTRWHLSELAIGGTAVGTGLNTHPEFAGMVIEKITNMTRLPFREAENHFEAQGSRDAIVGTSAALKTAAVGLMKIANDIRWAGSGPRCGIGELILPEVQPGSSIMPGKTNPVIAEAVCMVAAQVIGNDVTITVGGLSGNFELNTMMPVMAYDLLESIRLLANATDMFEKRCVGGITANSKRIEEMIESSLAMATALAPSIGYEAAAAIAKEAHESGKTVREVALEKKVLPEETLRRLLDPISMLEPRKES
jgi:fumarate hydratase class II